MSELVRTVSRFAIIGVVGGMAAACSSDALRLSGTPFSNPFASEQDAADPKLTGATERPAPSARIPRSTVKAEPLAPPAVKSAAAPAYNRPPAVAAASPQARPAGMNPAVAAVPAAAAPSPAQGRVVARTQLPVPAAKPKAVAVVEEKTRVRPGQPQMKVVAAAKPAKAADAKAAPEPKTTASAADPKTKTSRVKLAGAAETKPAPAKEVAKEAAKPAKPDAKAEKPVAGKVVKSEPVPVVAPKPAKAEVAAAPAPKAEPKVAAAPAPKVEPKVAAAKAPAPQKVAAVEPAKPVAQPEPAKPAPSKEPESTGALPAQPAAPSAEFRWPARGRVISGFGGGGANEGINIAVPDGTPVKAAESGTVAYAGNEVKGYGNLVLIRHDNGYVSAYAHNGDIDVKRGQKVNRGQVIAKSGQSGNVTSPQLHFEIRKGSTPIDPMPYLASN